MSLTADSQVRVRFVTKHKEFPITDAPFVLPAKLGRAGLSEVVNHLLDRVDHQPFDFSILNKLIRSPLYKFCQTHKLSSEDTIVIEYFPAVSFSSDSIINEWPAWIGSIDTKHGAIGFAGCYDGKLKGFSTSDLSVNFDLQAHSEPIRSIFSWKETTKDNTFNIVTASKDNHAKLWIYDASLGKVQLHADLVGHANSVEVVSYVPNAQKPDDSLILSGDWSGNLFAWKTAAGNNEEEVDLQVKKKRKGNAEDAQVVNVTKPLFTMKAHSQSISSILHPLNTHSIYTSSWDHSWKLWDLEKQDVISTINTARVITSMDLRLSSLVIATAHPDGKVRLWDNREKNTQSSLSFGKDTAWLSQVKWLPTNDNLFVTSDYSGVVNVWDVRSSVPLGKSEAHSGKALALDWCNDKNDEEGSIISGGSDCCLRKLSLQK